MLLTSICAGWWTGGTDVGREGSWYWVGSLASVPAWAWNQEDGEPNSGRYANCMTLYATWDGGYDVTCGSNNFPICQTGLLP